MAKKLLLVPLVKKFIRETANGKRRMANGQRLKHRTVANYFYLLKNLEAFEAFKSEPLCVTINIRSNRKIIEVLSFNNGVPTFGGRYFSFDQDTVKKPGASRYIMEYKKDAGPRLTYDNDLQMIVFEHMESETNEPNKKWTYVPDGDYEGFKWVSGKWMHVEKLFNQITAEGKEPVPAPVKDAEGNTMEDLLKDNMSNEKDKTDTPAIKPAAKPKAVKSKKKGNQ